MINERNMYIYYILHRVSPLYIAHILWAALCAPLRASPYNKPRLYIARIRPLCGLYAATIRNRSDEGRKKQEKRKKKKEKIPVYALFGEKGGLFYGLSGENGMGPSHEKEESGSLSTRKLFSNRYFSGLISFLLAISGPKNRCWACIF